MRTLFRLLLPAALGVAASAHASFDVNLIQNGGAEAGTYSPDGNSVVAIPNWTATGKATVVWYGAADYPQPTSPGPADRGHNFFCGGPGADDSTLTQTVSLEDDATAIDRGSVAFTLDGYLGGFYWQDDYATLTATFLSDSDTSLGTAFLDQATRAQRNSVTGLLERTATGFVPTGTRSVRFLLDMVRTHGVANDGYADDLSFVMKAPTAPVPEPASLATLAGGAVALLRRRRKA